MGYKTAAILSIVFVGGIFAVPFATDAILRSYMEQGTVIPFYVRGFLGVSIFCAAFKWIVVPPIVGGLFTFAALTTHGRAGK